jgi:CDP-paratose 2-epimerase
MKLLISGAAGFIGVHAAASFLRRGAVVVALDNLSRPGSVENLAWIKAQGGELHFHHLDIRNGDNVMRLFAQHPDADAVLHLAAQVAVTSSVTDPRHDFEVNALGTFNLLEATRQFCPGAAFLYASTNKVYGELDQAAVVERDGRYAYASRPEGIDEECPLDLHSPYGCSKGAADQYVHDYHRIYGLKSVVFRQSCIYGTRQFGVEDQGWVAWFTIAALAGFPVTIYGDGKQVRDVLWVEDLIDLYSRAIERIDVAAGQIYNVGGGPRNTLSLRELVAVLESEAGARIYPAQANWRPGDQKIFVAGISKAKRDLAWVPRVTPDEGVQRLIKWVRSESSMVAGIVGSLKHTPILLSAKASMQ